MRHLNNGETFEVERQRSYTPKETSQRQWLIVFLGKQSSESEINSFLAKARNLGYRGVLKPDYMHLLGVIHKIENSYLSGDDMVETLDRLVHSAIDVKHERVAIVFDREDFNSSVVFKQVLCHLKFTPICSTVSVNDSLNGNGIDCGKANCRNCDIDIPCSHNCIFRLIRLILYGFDAGEYVAPS